MQLFTFNLCHVLNAKIVRSCRRRHMPHTHVVFSISVQRLHNVYTHNRWSISCTFIYRYIYAYMWMCVLSPLACLNEIYLTRVGIIVVLTHFPAVLPAVFLRTDSIKTRKCVYIEQRCISCNFSKTICMFVGWFPTHL